jgi:hypothetical protein
VKPSLINQADSERLQISMPEAGFETADNSIQWQRSTIRPSPGLKMAGESFIIPKAVRIVCSCPREVFQMSGYKIELLLQSVQYFHSNCECD